MKWIPCPRIVLPRFCGILSVQKWACNTTTEVEYALDRLADLDDNTFADIGNHVVDLENTGGLSSGESRGEPEEKICCLS
jgi:hypothetical protein